MSSTRLARGRFFVFDGGEGGGKSTQIDILADKLRREGYPVRTTREPGGTVLGEAIRQVLMGQYDPPIPPMSELLLIFAARAAHLAEVIEPALAAGEIVLCDRFTDASFAYQGAARGLGEQAVATMQHLVQGQLRPDGVLILDLPVEKGLMRARKRISGNRFDEEAIDFHARVRQAYLQRARVEPARYAVIDADRPVAEVSGDVEVAIKAWLS